MHAEPPTPCRNCEREPKLLYGTRAKLKRRFAAVVLRKVALGWFRQIS